MYESKRTILRTPLLFGSINKSFVTATAIASN